MASRRPNPPVKVELDERFVAEWILWGLKELEAFLAHHAAYERWCVSHHRTPE